MRCLLVALAQIRKGERGEDGQREEKTDRERRRRTERETLADRLYGVISGERDASLHTHIQFPRTHIHKYTHA